MDQSYTHPLDRKRKFSESVARSAKRRKKIDLRFQMQTIFWGRRTVAKNKGIEFTIDFDDIPYVESCPIFDTPFTYGGPRDTSPSIDRIDIEKGYVKGNVRWISHLANRWKNNMRYEDMKILLDRFHKTC